MESRQTSFSRPDVYALASMLGLTFLLFWRYFLAWPTPLIFPQSSLGTDLPREILPLAYFIRETLRQTGQLPLWRPYLLSGAPLMGHPVAPVLYLPNWLTLVLPLPLALNLLAVLHLWWSGAGIYLVLRFQGRRPEAAFLAALLFALSPKWIAHLSGGHWPTLAAIAWWPWVWLCFSRYWATGRRRWAAGLGVALAAQALNHGTYLAISLVCLGLCSAGFLIRDRWAGVRRAAAGWGVALAVLVGLSAGQLWPLAELISYSARAALTQAEAMFGSLPPALLVGTLFAPDLKFPEWFVFPGVGMLCLAGLGWARAKGWSQRGWALVAGAGLLMSLGNNTPLYEILYRWAPGFAFFRTPTRWWLLTLFGLTILAALGVDRWLDRAVARTRRGLSVLLELNLFYWGAAGLKVVAPQWVPFDVIPSAVTLLLTSVILAAGPLAAGPSKWRWRALVVVVLIDIGWAAGTLIHPVAEAALEAPDAVTALLQSAARDGERSFAPYGDVSDMSLAVSDLRAADGYDSFPLAAYADLGRAVGGCDYAGYVVAVPPTRASPAAAQACPHFQPNRPLMALLNIRYVILPEPLQLPEASLALTDGTRWVYDFGPGLGRAWGVKQSAVTAPALCLNRAKTLDPATEALVEAPLPFGDSLSAPQVLAHQSGVNEEYFLVKADAPGLLVRSETWAPGWQVRVDDQAAEVLRVDCAMQGVWLNAGVHQVRFEYAPLGYRVGKWVSGLMAAGLLAGGAWLAGRHVLGAR